jgi:hypothetical protein
VTGNTRVALALFLAFLIAPCPVDAIVMRHDRDEQAFIDLARKFPATVALRSSANRAVLAGMGTLIHPRWVVTAGHVADSLAPGDLAVLGGTTYEIVEVVKHPEWRGPTSWEHLRMDIALIRLRTAVADVVPVRLYTQSDELDMSATLVGSCVARSIQREELAICRSCWDGAASSSRASHIRCAAGDGIEPLRVMTPKASMLHPMSNGSSESMPKPA